MWVDRLVSRGQKKESFLYCKKFFIETLLNFWPIGAGSLKLSRLAGFQQFFMTFDTYPIMMNNTQDFQRKVLITLKEILVNSSLFKSE